jgi:Sulfate permease family
MTGARSVPARDRWRFVPMARWIRSYRRRWLKGDLIAGIAVAALIVPKNLGYAGIAGIPVQNGLYAAAAGAILYAVFGTSRQISTGPSSGLAAVAASAVAAAGITGVHNAASFVAMITLVSGALFLVLAVLKMGWTAQFLSRAVVTGFLFGAAIDVVIGELRKLTGTKVTGSNPLQELWSWIGRVAGGKTRAQRSVLAQHRAGYHVVWPGAVGYSLRQVHQHPCEAGGHASGGYRQDASVSDHDVHDGEQDDDDDAHRQEQM